METDNSQSSTDYVVPGIDDIVPSIETDEPSIHECSSSDPDHSSQGDRDSTPPTTQPSEGTHDTASQQEEEQGPPPIKICLHCDVRSLRCTFSSRHRNPTITNSPAKCARCAREDKACLISLTSLQSETMAICIVEDANGILAVYGDVTGELSDDDVQYELERAWTEEHDKRMYVNGMWVRTSDVRGFALPRWGKGKGEDHWSRYFRDDLPGEMEMWDECRRRKGIILKPDVPEQVDPPVPDPAPVPAPQDEAQRQGTPTPENPSCSEAKKTGEDEASNATYSDLPSDFDDNASRALSTLSSVRQDMTLAEMGIHTMIHSPGSSRFGDGFDSWGGVVVQPGDPLDCLIASPTVSVVRALSPAVAEDKFKDEYWKV